MYAEWGTTQMGKAREPALLNSLSVQPSHFDGTLSHHLYFSGPLLMGTMSFGPNDMRTAIFFHCFVFRSPIRRAKSCLPRYEIPGTGMCPFGPTGPTTWRRFTAI